MRVLSSQAIRRRPAWCGLVRQNAGRIVGRGEGRGRMGTGVSPGPEVVSRHAVFVVAFASPSRTVGEDDQRNLYPT
jgi:hypothetical protein